MREGWWGKALLSFKVESQKSKGGIMDAMSVRCLSARVAGTVRNMIYAKWKLSSLDWGEFAESIYSRC